jgi:hypothetical protein
MTIFSNINRPVNQQTNLAVFNQNRENINISIDNNIENRYIKHDKNIYDQNFKSYIGLYNNEVTYNNSKVINITLTEKAVREFKYNISLNKFNAGYPESDSYRLCSETLGSIISIGSKHYTTSYDQISGYPKGTSIKTVQESQHTPLSCNTCQGIICQPGETFDPVSCRCVVPALCVDQPPDCEIVSIPQNLKGIINGYAYYANDINVPIDIPGIGLVNPTCARGHCCDRTIFMPILVKSDGSQILANKTINMNNLNGDICGSRFDTFSFATNGTEDIVDSQLVLRCELQYCHTGVTFIVLVGYDATTNDPVVLFKSCVAPGPTNTKLIGTIDCSGPIVECDPTSTPMPTPTPTITPSITSTSTPTTTPTTTPTITKSITPTPTPTPCIQSNCTYEVAEVGVTDNLGNYREVSIVWNDMDQFLATSEAFAQEFSDAGWVITAVTTAPAIGICCNGQCFPPRELLPLMYETASFSQLSCESVPIDPNDTPAVTPTTTPTPTITPTRTPTQTPPSPSVSSDFI